MSEYEKARRTVKERVETNAEIGFLQLVVYGRSNHPGVRKTMEDGIRERAQFAIASYIILELISKHEELHPEANSPITQLVNGGKMNELADEIIKSEQFDKYFGKVNKNFNTCGVLFYEMYHNPQCDERKQCYNAGMEFLLASKEKKLEKPQEKEAVMRNELKSEQQKEGKQRGK